jgi:hypothetical protein
MRTQEETNMQTPGLNLPTLVSQVARIYDDNQLEALLLDYAADCRGLCADSAQLHTAAELLRVRGVANAIFQLCEFSRPEIEPLVRSLLLSHPRRESALRLIEEYSRDAEEFNKLQHQRERARIK